MIVYDYNIFNINIKGYNIYLILGSNAQINNCSMIIKSFYKDYAVNFLGIDECEEFIKLNNNFESIFSNKKLIEIIISNENSLNLILKTIISKINNIYIKNNIFVILVNNTLIQIKKTLYFDYINKNGLIIISYLFNKYCIISWIKGLLIFYKKKINDNVPSYIYLLYKYNIDKIDQMIKKIVYTFEDKKNIEIEDIKKLVLLKNKYSIENLIESLVNKDIKKSIDIYNYLKNNFLNYGLLFFLLKNEINNLVKLNYKSKLNNNNTNNLTYNEIKFLLSRLSKIDGCIKNKKEDQLWNYIIEIVLCILNK